MSRKVGNVDAIREAAESLCDAVDVPELMGHCATGCRWCANMEQDIAAAKDRLRAALAAHPAACDHIWGDWRRSGYVRCAKCGAMKPDENLTADYLAAHPAASAKPPLALIQECRVCKGTGFVDRPAADDDADASEPDPILYEETSPDGYLIRRRPAHPAPAADNAGRAVTEDAIHQDERRRCIATIEEVSVFWEQGEYKSVAKLKRDILTALETGELPSPPTAAGDASGIPSSDQLEPCAICGAPAGVRCACDY